MQPDLTIVDTGVQTIPQAGMLKTTLQHTSRVSPTLHMKGTCALSS